MTTRRAARLLVAAAAPWFLATAANAEPFDLIQFSYQVNTGVRLVSGPNDRSDGAFIAFPIPDYLAVKPYTAQPISPGSTDRNESYLEYVAGQPDAGFASAQADAGRLEVGIDKQNGAPGSSVAVSRMNVTIKNHLEDRSLNLLEFAFEIPAGHIAITDFAESFAFTRGHVHASIDYLLKSPAGPFGGTWDETTGSLFDYFVLVEGTEQPPPRQVEVTSSGHARVTTAFDRNRVRADIGAYEGKVRLPSIPPFGELTLYYDMYAFLGTARAEVLGEAFLGDPMNFSSDGWFRLTLPDGEPDDDPESVPEPSALLLLAGAALVAAVRRRRD